MMAMMIFGSAFREGEPIPMKYSCEGEGISPPLAWSGVPETAKTLALICEDPDAPHGTYIHWVLYNISMPADSLRENIPQEPVVDGVGEQGLNSAHAYGYIGPCPPSGTHRYYFTLYALDTRLDIAGEVNAASLRRAMQGHILAEAQLMGRYTRAQSGKRAA